jgi:putative IMPACT (imprinted ancient) family translation regulator
MRVMQTKIDYTWLGKVENEVRSSQYQLKEINYLDMVEVAVYVEEALKEQFVEWMTELTNGQGDIQEAGTEYLESGL